ncbi:hypothetical protein QBC40DRAFT_277122 [Triangularia verruculosa]|uniref:6-phosphogluconate dehydrogenase NADP-binding domain-containing protein n=1 Tax=Triangularia verruculosa TaxID=2587418 RepID=A0AAN6XPG3_9PEZI|nr:hypothetical protein QBC40DRAFT_277122 [Triangularia verruculosa]
MIGTGSMGGMMSLLLADHNIHTHFYDPDRSNVEKLLSQAADTNHLDKITHHDYHKSLCSALPADSPKVFLFSIPHGGAADASISDLSPFFKKGGDIIMDASNDMIPWPKSSNELIKG